MLRTTWHSQTNARQSEARRLAARLTQTQFAGGVAPALPEHEPLPEQEAFVPSVDAGAAEPAGAAPFALQLAFAPAAEGSAAGADPPPQPPSTPNMIPETAETARTLPIFILAFLLVELNKPIVRAATRRNFKGVLTSPANKPNSYAARCGNSVWRLVATMKIHRGDLSTRQGYKGIVNTG